MTGGKVRQDVSEVTAELLSAAMSGDQDAFAELVAPLRGELRLHCYRILGSVTDAEDAVQETLVTAWRGLPGFDGRSSLRTWLYRVATTRSLNVLRARRRRIPIPATPPAGNPPPPTRVGEVRWLEPYPDAYLDEIPDAAAGPAGIYETREAVSLAFITALQLLPPRQRAVLVLRDVLEFPARQVAEILDVTEQSVTSALKRARSTLAAHRESPAADPPSAGTTAEERLVARLVDAWERADVPGIVALLSQDVRVTMPPLPFEYEGRDLAGEFFRAVAFRDGRRYRLLPTRANGQPAVAAYLLDPHTGVGHPSGLLVLTVTGGRVAAVTRFESGVFAHFGLSRLLPTATPATSTAAR
jgi:RNA polymerase sigma-70 factor (ECF subfamily)